MDGNEALSILQGGHLDTVSFVMDYVEVRIGYSVLRSQCSHPKVRLSDGSIYEFPEDGSRDALCSLIDSNVVAASEVEADTDDWRIEVRTDKGHVLAIPLGSERRVGGPEAAHLVPADASGRLEVSEMWIW